MQSTRQPATTVCGDKFPRNFLSESGESHGIRVEFHRGNFEKGLKGILANFDGNWKDHLFKGRNYPPQAKKKKKKHLPIRM